jgi:PEP-CTERM motif-containing protein
MAGADSLRAPHVNRGAPSVQQRSEGTPRGTSIAPGLSPRRIMKKLCPVLVGLLLYMGPSVPSAWADPFAVQDGRLFGDPFGGALIWNSGIPPDAFGGLGVASGEFTLSPTFNPEIVQPGQQFTLTAIFGGTLAGEVSVPSAGGHDVDVRGTGDLHMTSAPLLAPAPFPGGADEFGFISLTTAFSMSGILEGTLLEVVDQTSHPLGSFRTEVFGHGTATVLLQPLFETGNYQLALFDGTFEPVPEPGTIMLLGFGAATLAARHARRHKAAAH